MVSGLVTSPELHERICLEEARPISMASKLLMSINLVSLLISCGVVRLVAVRFLLGLLPRDRFFCRKFVESDDLGFLA